ncbi:MAG: type II toxin-antitoxin system HicB family antitoxin [Lachnospiraceae bacterium]|nr:type II toxin-antitoxin system HicB family antitoxin [Lachnospiraceae bacterium]MBQ6544414.1 type II toxin-antitoxin system HicB family antitoxin [Lachnospiraceae bacterium]
MKFVYPAILSKTEHGYHVTFPDLTGCEADGETEFDALRAAQDAMYNWIELELSEEEPELPVISDPAEIVLSENEEVRNIMITWRFHTGYDE